MQDPHTHLSDSCYRSCPRLVLEGCLKSPLNLSSNQALAVHARPFQHRPLLPCSSWTAGFGEEGEAYWGGRTRHAGALQAQSSAES